MPAGPVEGATERRIDLDVLESDYFAPVVSAKIPFPDARIELDIRTSTTEVSDE